MKIVDSLDALWRTMCQTLLSSKLIPNKPGAVVESMSPEIRKLLSELKSNDIGINIIMPDKKYFQDTKYVLEKQIKSELIEFDKKLKK